MDSGMKKNDSKDVITFFAEKINLPLPVKTLWMFEQF
jgi:hypothetical protein